MTFSIIFAAAIIGPALLGVALDKIAPARTMADEGDVWAEEA